MHDVDEDDRTISMHGAMWTSGEMAGIACRDVGYEMFALTDVQYLVASVCRHPKLIIYHTDLLDVDEDMMIFTYHGGAWIDGSWVGIVNRFMNNAGIGTSSEYVASSNMKS